MGFVHLFTPFEVGGVEIRNRIFSTGHQTLLAREHLPNQDLAAYHEARGGGGLIVVEAARPHAGAASSAPVINAFDDDCIPGYRAIADAVHRHGCRAFGQLIHSGRVNPMIRDGMKGVTYSASDVRDHRFHNVPRAMPAAMVEEVIASFASAAGRIVEAGLDGVEIGLSHGTLFAQFLSPATNLRNDAWGGDGDRRFRALGETMRAVRETIGREPAFGLRVSIGDDEPDGLDAEAMLAVCRRIEAEGQIDYLNVTVGSMAALGSSVHVVPPMQVDHAYTAPLAGLAKGTVALPVFVAGRINQPQIAERVLAEGLADMCGMTRAMIADPEMPNKARAGRLDDIRACIGCNQACIGHFHQGVSISCIQFPESGRERRFAEHPRTATPKRVLVAGGGPAGLKAAATAAARGHRVTLCEADRRLGGQVALAEKLPGRGEFGGLAVNLARECERAGVEVRLATTVDAALIAAHAPDAVIVAAGATPFRPDAAFEDGAHVVDAWQVLTGEANVGGRAVVADWRCDWVGMGIAQKLAEEGRHVRLCVDGLHAGQNLQSYLRDHWAGKLQALGVEIIPYARLHGADEDSVYFAHGASGEPVVCDGVDTLVLAAGHRSETALEHTVRASGVEMHLAGDCLSPRSAEEAVYEGMLAGRAV